MNELISASVFVHIQLQKRLFEQRRSSGNLPCELALRPTRMFRFIKKCDFDKLTSFSDRFFKTITFQRLFICVNIWDSFTIKWTFGAQIQININLNERLSTHLFRTSQICMPSMRPIFIFFWRGFLISFPSHCKENRPANRVHSCLSVCPVALVLDVTFPIHSSNRDLKKTFL